jgi:hypothetical protein
MKGNGRDKRQGNVQEQDVNQIRGTNKYEWALKKLMGKTVTVTVTVTETETETKAKTRKTDKCKNRVRLTGVHLRGATGSCGHLTMHS